MQWIETVLLSKEKTLKSKTLSFNANQTNLKISGNVFNKIELTKYRSDK